MFAHVLRSDRVFSTCPQWICYLVIATYVPGVRTIAMPGGCQREAIWLSLKLGSWCWKPEKYTTASLVGLCPRRYGSGIRGLPQPCVMH